jgi:hypothetical protein
MKAQRRHALKQNTLAGFFEDLPNLLREFGSRIAVGIILVALIVVWIRYRYASSAERLDAARQSLAEASNALRTLQNSTSNSVADEPLVAQQRHFAYDQGLTLVNDAIERGGDKDSLLKARALNIKGDLEFTLANLPSLSGASTQPSLRPEQPTATLLATAADAYTQVLEQSTDPTADAAARFGLAAVTEDLAAINGAPQQWDLARQQYQKILDSDASPAFKNLATEKLQSLSQLEQPIALNFPAPATQPTTLPSTAPSPAAALPATNPSAR